jgi:hypothetical protein
MKDEYFYPLYEQFDKDFFNKLKLAIINGFVFSGTQEEKQQFIKDLLNLQLIKDYRKHLKIIFKHLDKKIDIAAINHDAVKVNFNFNNTRAKFKVEKELLVMGKRLAKADIRLEGSDKRFNEFLLRYLCSIWLVDWAGPLYAIFRKLGSDQYILDLREMNKILALWDFTGIFNFKNQRTN